MTKASKPGALGPDGEPHEPGNVRRPAVGPYLDPPAEVLPSPDHFFAVVQQLESDLAARWAGPTADRSTRRADESIAR